MEKSTDRKTSPNVDPYRSILKKTTEADCGLIKVPVLVPHLEFRSIGDRQVLLVSETFNTLLHGQIVCDILPLLDGRRTHRDIIEFLASTHLASDIQTALTFLATKGYIVSGEYHMERGQAAYWSSQGVSPRWAEERLKASRLEIAGDEGHPLTQRLEAMGVGLDRSRPTLSVIVCTDFLDERNANLNRRHITSGLPWILVRPKGVFPLFGPVFRPAEQGPCWACLAYRLQGQQEVHNFLRNRAGYEAAFRPFAAEPVVLETAYGLIAAEIAKWLILRELAAIHEHAMTLDVTALKTARHPVHRRPQCTVCGEKRYYSPDRPASPVRLKPSLKNVHNSGGLRSVPPEETLAKYRHLISPVSGVVTWIERTTDVYDHWLHVHWAGSNLALRVKNLSSLRRSLRSKSAGKGSTAEQSEVSALCEAVERYSGAFHGDEIRTCKRFSEFVDKGQESDAIHPNQVQLFSDHQLDHADEINARQHPYNIVPGRFDPDAAIDWSPVWSLTQNRHRYLPTSMLYSMTPEQRCTSDLWADSNGCAAGNTLEEAIQQGFFELVERDAFAIWWYNRLRFPAVDLESFDDVYLASAPDYYRQLHRDMWLLDITGDFGIPAFVSISRRTDSQTEDILYGAGAHTDPHIAALRAVCEMNQCLTWVPRPESGHAGYGVDDLMCLSWWKNATLEEHPYLAPDPEATLRGRSDYPVPETSDVKEDVEGCCALVKAKGLDMLVLEQTRPDIGMPVARVIVPGLRHFWERVASGRLYDVPVKMGLREKPLAEADLNPVPVIA
ncbi:MAG: TOMM precursor leader peptide-binding protein [Gammaproteobacteria bacterium]|nr:TOMM precursor leader peptide-binding protein [Gammaproteobacteria bacterium]